MHLGSSTASGTDTASCRRCSSQDVGLLGASACGRLPSCGRRGACFHFDVLAELEVRLSIGLLEHRGGTFGRCSSCARRRASRCRKPSEAHRALEDAPQQSLAARMSVALHCSGSGSPSRALGGDPALRGRDGTVGEVQARSSQGG